MTEGVTTPEPALQETPPRGGLPAVGLGLLVFGVATYVYLSVAGRALSPEVFAPLSVMWTLLNAVGIGLFLPFEQELGRRTAAARAVGAGNRALTRRSLLAALVLLALLTIASTVAIGPFTARLLGGYTVLVPLFLMALAGMAASYVARGLLAGRGRFGRYGAQLAVDGVLRVLGATALHLAGSQSVGAYGAVLVVAPVLAVGLTTPRPSSLVSAGERAEPRVGRSALPVLVAASLTSQLLANAGPVVVQYLASAAERAASGHFTAALVVARVPLFAFAAVQAVLLPGLAGLVGGSDLGGFRRRVRAVLAVTAGLGALGSVLIWGFGARVVPLLFSDAFGVARQDITLIAVSGAVFMVAQVAAQALLALGRERWVLIGWVVGMAGLLIPLAWSGPLTTRVAWALVAGSGAAALALLAFLVRGTRRWAAEQGFGRDG